MAPMSYRDDSGAQSHFFTFSPSSKSRRTAAASAPADVSALAGAKVASAVATAAVDELVPVRAMSSLPLRFARRNDLATAAFGQ
jgi:hypothetical protein